MLQNFKIQATLALMISIILFFGAGAQMALAQESGRVYIDVGRAQVKRSLIALPPLQFSGSNASNQENIQLGQELFSVISNNLTVSNLFTFIKPEAFLENPAEVGLRPAPGDPKGFNFQNWQTIGTEFLIRAGYRVTRNEVSLEAYVYFVPQGRLIFGKTYTGPRTAARRIAHTFSDDILLNLTGRRGMFNTRLVLSTDREAGRGQKEIWVMDWDGANAEQITDHKSIAISPTWSPDGKKVAYTAYAYHTQARTRNANLFLRELDTGRRLLLSYRRGINSGANFFPNGQHILLTLSQGGRPDIFRITADGKSIQPITRGPAGAMNVEPAVSPDGRQIAFSSDRSGRPMIYVMNVDGSNVRRITHAGRYNSSPSWSPDGRQIAFAALDKGSFDIFVINTDGTGLKRLTDAKRRNGTSAHNENPSFSPCGRHIVFVSDRDGNRQLYIVSPDGSNERRLTFDSHNYYQPKWSPFLN